MSVFPWGKLFIWYDFQSCLSLSMPFHCLSLCLVIRVNFPKSVNLVNLNCFHNHSGFFSTWVEFSWWQWSHLCVECWLVLVSVLFYFSWLSLLVRIVHVVCGDWMVNTFKWSRSTRKWLAVPFCWLVWFLFVLKWNGCIDYWRSKSQHNSKIISGEKKIALTIYFFRSCYVQRKGNMAMFVWSKLFTSHYCWFWLCNKGASAARFTFLGTGGTCRDKRNR